MGFDEKRRFTRVPYKVDVTVSCGDSTLTARQLKDISLGGMYILSDKCLDVETKCDVTLSLTGTTSRLLIRLTAEVIRCDEATAQEDARGMALRFRDMDLDGLIHLQHFIRIRSGDPEAIDKEYFEALLEVEDR
ncbi:PilZ domain-containing protein [Thermodesulfobacteriota bacterium]